MCPVLSVLERPLQHENASLIGDWGVHILGPANWALQLSPDSLISV